MLEQYKDRKICIGYPAPELSDYRFNNSLLELITQSSSMVPLCLTNAISSRIAVNRNLIVDMARKQGATDILWLDADTKFPINGLLRLLAHDKDSVGATTRRRKQGSDKMPIGIAAEVPKPDQRLVNMRMIGFPFMLTRISVFDKLEKPYFSEPPRRILPEIDTCFDELVAEDEYFCHYARKAGFDIWCDMELSMEIGHIGSTVFYLEPEGSAEVAKIDLDLTSDEQFARNRDMIGE